MPQSDLKAGLRIVGFVLLTLLIGVVVIWSLGGFACASAGDVIYEEEVEFNFPSATLTSYNHTSTVSSGTFTTTRIEHIWIYQKSEVGELSEILLVLPYSSSTWATDATSPMSYYLHSAIEDEDDPGVTIGNCTHGFSISESEGVVRYHIFFDILDNGDVDLDLSGSDEECILKIVSLWGSG